MFGCMHASANLGSVGVWENIHSFRFLALIWPPYFSNTCFTLSLASWVATSPNPALPWLGSPVTGISVLIPIKNSVWSTTEFISPPWLLTLRVHSSTNQYISLLRSFLCDTVSTRKSKAHGNIIALWYLKLWHINLIFKEGLELIPQWWGLTHPQIANEAIYV